MSILGSIIGAGSSLVGGLLGNSSANAAMDLQKKAMQKGIQWKVADAKAAGIHPLFALGASTSMPSAVISPLGESVAAAGQDISRAVDAMSDSREKASSMSKALGALQLERGALENEMLRSQIRRLNAPGSPPASPESGDTAIVPGQGDSRAPLTLVDGITVKPRASETPAQPLTDEYGEAADFVGGLRLARDAEQPVTTAMKNYLWSQWEKVRRGEPNDLFTPTGRLRGWYPDPRLFKTDRYR